MQTNNHTGRLVKPFELQHFGQKNTAKVNFCLAINAGKDKTDFIYYVAYGKTAELLHQYANQKGMMMTIIFDMHSRTYTNNNNESKYIVENVVSEFQVMGSVTNKTQNDELPNDVSNQAKSDFDINANGLFNIEPPVDTNNYFPNPVVEGEYYGG